MENTTYKITIKKIFKHLKKVLYHKWWVFVYCCKYRLYLRGILHDVSKFSPIEFFESAKYYDGKKSPIEICKRVNGYSNAWLHHKGRNRHHYEYWRDGIGENLHPICMPYKDTMEMICDFIAAAKAYNGKKFTYQLEYDWWQEKRYKAGFKMHFVQVQMISFVLGFAIRNGELPSPEKCKSIYADYVAVYNKCKEDE